MHEKFKSDQVIEGLPELQPALNGPALTFGRHKKG